MKLFEIWKLDVVIKIGAFCLSMLAHDSVYAAARGHFRINAEGCSATTYCQQYYLGFHSNTYHKMISGINVWNGQQTDLSFLKPGSRRPPLRRFDSGVLSAHQPGTGLSTNKTGELIAITGIFPLWEYTSNSYEERPDLP